jgi:hypothetical protein
MRHLWLEELEPRLLLRHVGLALPQPILAGITPAPAEARAPLIHMGGRADAVGQDGNSIPRSGKVHDEAVGRERPAARDSWTADLDDIAAGASGEQGRFELVIAETRGPDVAAAGCSLTGPCRPGSAFFAVEDADSDIAGARNLLVRSDEPSPGGGSVIGEPGQNAVTRAVAAVSAPLEPTGGRALAAAPSLVAVVSAPLEPTGGRALAAAPSLVAAVSAPLDAIGGRALATATSLVAAAFSDLANSTVAPRLGSVVSPPGFRAEAQVLALARTLVGAEGDVAPHVVGSWLSGSAGLSPRDEFIPPAAELDGEAAVTGPALPPPLVSDLLDVLRCPDVVALEREMQQFLGEVDQLGQRLTPRPEGVGLGPWLVAGIAAAVACEIARRQVKRSAEVAAEGPTPLSGSLSHPRSGQP